MSRERRRGWILLAEIALALATLLLILAMWMPGIYTRLHSK